ncbi:MAG TPA: nucleotide sugar dehydrogenase [Polyangiaceae bacterium]|jgi:UDP-N-acetyl-D-galactosamine dehydrogenase|nr:nucleotide sugar dehydrogenase [Polyangiaceae bacterium]
MEERIAVIGLGYVGLPIAVAFAKKFPGTVGFDISSRRVESLRRGVDATREVADQELKGSTLNITDDPSALRGSTFFVVAVPTPIDDEHRPDMQALISASEAVGAALTPGAIVVYESTVYPGVTEDICGPILEKASGLTRGTGFKLGYSPERINPGDTEHTFEKIIKVVAAEDHESLQRVARIYGSVVTAGVHRAPSIKVAEAAKAIENVQRDLNIALMNELALICDRIGIRTVDVLRAAGTKWNFLKFEPGLVGGHCIGVDPYYLTALAEKVGYHPQVILSGRRINEGMGPFVAQRLIKQLALNDIPIKSARVGILGLTFKQDVPDLRNTKVVDIVRELHEFGIDPLLHDPLVTASEAAREYGVRIKPWEELTGLDAMVVAVPHREFVGRPVEELLKPLRQGGLLFDLKSAIDPSSARPDVKYWSL